MEQDERIVFGFRFVQIALAGNKELYWDITEWEEDSSVVFSICNAIKLFYTDRSKLYEIAKVTH